MTLNTYTKVEHLLVSPRVGPRDWVDELLADRGRTRHVAFTMPTFGPAPLALETTDLVLTCLRRVGVVFVERTGMAMTECPITAPPAVKSIDMVWHARLGNHPAHIWLRELLREVAASTEGVALAKVRDATQGSVAP